MSLLKGIWCHKIKLSHRLFKNKLKKWWIIMTKVKAILLTLLLHLIVLWIKQQIIIKQTISLVIILLIEAVFNLAKLQIQQIKGLILQNGIIQQIILQRIIVAVLFRLGIIVIQHNKEEIIVDNLLQLIIIPGLIEIGPLIQQNQSKPNWILRVII